MVVPSKKKIVLLGMMTKIPVGGVQWLMAQYVIGFQRLGYDVYYVEAHARTPSMFTEFEGEDASLKAAKFINGVMTRLGLEDKWAFHALHSDGRVYGMSDTRLKELYASADLLMNMHGGTIALPEHSATNRLLYLGTDPVELEIELFNNDQNAIEFLKPHRAFYTWGVNYGNPDCLVPETKLFDFHPSLPPVVMDLWDNPFKESPDAALTTIGNWRQPWREITFRGEVYHWSKHLEFMKFIDLPSRTNQPLELALSSYEEEDKRMLEGKGWRVRHGLDVSLEMEPYQKYIQQSRGEFTVAKDQNVRLRSGWFSERSATYLAAGRPVITQETGFSNVVPSGEGLFGFTTLDEAAAAIEAINSDYPRHCRRARELAREYFNYDVVLPKLLSQTGL
jgi:hypothetical protein